MPPIYCLIERPLIGLVPGFVSVEKKNYVTLHDGSFCIDGIKDFEVKFPFAQIQSHNQPKGHHPPLTWLGHHREYEATGNF